MFDAERRRDRNELRASQVRGTLVLCGDKVTSFMGYPDNSRRLYLPFIDRWCHACVRVFRAEKLRFVHCMTVSDVGVQGSRGERRTKA